jgi:hypothetical protein
MNFLILLIYLGDRRNTGENSCNSGDGMGQMAQPLMFMMMMMMNLFYIGLSHTLETLTYTLH